MKEDDGTCKLLIIIQISILARDKPRFIEDLANFPLEIPEFRNRI